MSHRVRSRGRGTADRWRWLLLGVPLFLLFCVPAPAAAQDMHPRDLAFNSGAFNAEIVQGAVADGTAEIQNMPGGDLVVRHVWVESFETDRATSTLLLTVFESCESTFANTLSGGRALTKLEIAYVLLDYAGRPVGVPQKVTYQQSGTSWTRTIAQFNSRTEFESRLTPFTLKYLRSASGQLDRYPGQPIAPYAADLAASAFGRLLGVVLAPVTLVAAPEEFLLVMIVAAANDIMKDQIKALTVDAFHRMFANGGARWGRANRPVSVALSDPNKLGEYAGFGTNIWPAFGVNLDGAWESQDDNARFRLEISGAVVKWLERSRDATESESVRTVVMSRDADGRFTIRRPVDEGLARFQFGSSFRTVIAANPSPTSLSFSTTPAGTAAPTGLSGNYVGVRLNAGTVTMSSPIAFTFKKVNQQ